MKQKLLIKNEPAFHYEIIESVIVKYNEILNIKKNTQFDIYLYIRGDNVNYKQYLKDKYPEAIFENIKDYDYLIDCTIYDDNFKELEDDENSRKKYISHEITNRLKTNPNVYFLTPLSKTNFIYADILPFSNNKIKSNIPIYIIQGSMHPDRRNYQLIQRILERSYEYKFIIKIIGFGDNIPTQLRKHMNKIVLKKNLNFIDYHTEFLDAYCILPLISKKTHPTYYKNKLTSSINYARGYELKCLLDKDLQDIYELNNAEIYNDIDDITIGFVKTLEQFYNPAS
jgi:hypothetical protein